LILKNWLWQSATLREGRENFRLRKQFNVSALLSRKLECLIRQGLEAFAGLINKLTDCIGEFCPGGDPMSNIDF
jgi:hypothetical protein